MKAFVARTNISPHFREAHFKALKGAGKLSEDIAKMNKGNKEDFGNDLEDARNSLVEARKRAEKALDKVK